MLQINMFIIQHIIRWNNLGDCRLTASKPYRVFTETGVSMLSAVLRSKTAAAVSVRIMDAFVEMRHFIASNAAMFGQFRAVELRQLEYQKTTDERFERVFDYMETYVVPKQKVLFDDQVYDAFEFLVSLVQKAEKSIVPIDGYVDIQSPLAYEIRVDTPLGLHGQLHASGSARFRLLPSPFSQYVEARDSIRSHAPPRFSAFRSCCRRHVWRPPPKTAAFTRERP